MTQISCESRLGGYEISTNILKDNARPTRCLPSLSEKRTENRHDEPLIANNEDNEKASSPCHNNNLEETVKVSTAGLQSDRKVQQYLANTLESLERAVSLRPKMHEVNIDAFDRTIEAEASALIAPLKHMLGKSGISEISILSYLGRLADVRECILYQPGFESKACRAGLRTCIDDVIADLIWALNEKSNGSLTAGVRRSLDHLTVLEGLSNLKTRIAINNVFEGIVTAAISQKISGFSSEQEYRQCLFDCELYYGFSAPQIDKTDDGIPLSRPAPSKEKALETGSIADLEARAAMRADYRARRFHRD